MNGNWLVDRGKLEHLRRLRDAAKEVDVAYVSNVWGGREHSMHVFERLAALDCSKDLLAVFPRGFPPEEDEANIREWIQGFAFDALDAALEEAESLRRKLFGAPIWGRKRQAVA